MNRGEDDRALTYAPRALRLLPHLTSRFVLAGVSVDYLIRMPLFGYRRSRCCCWWKDDSVGGDVVATVFSALPTYIPVEL